MRLNPWLDERNHEREMTLLDRHFGDADATQNTAFCLFEPDAPGLTAGSFPTKDSVFFGTRPGKRYAWLPALADLTEEEATELVTKKWLTETHGLEPDPKLIERLVWEYRNVTDGVGLAKVMNDLAAKHPAKGGEAVEVPRLPVMPNLQQALNIAAADSRGVIVVVHPDGGDEAMERRLAGLAFEQGIAGRTHMARMTAGEWADAKDVGLISGGAQETGVVFVAPDQFGLDGKVWAEIAPDATQERMREDLAAALDRFRKEWRKLDRKSHLVEGALNNISWSEYDPDLGNIVRIEGSSKKLGQDTGHH